MKHVLEFILPVRCPLPWEHEIDVFVRAEVRHVSGEPGSLSIQPGWDVLRVDATYENGRTVTGLIEWEQIDAAVKRECEKIAL